MRYISEADFFAQEREADTLAAFCVSGNGHANIVYQPAEPAVGAVASRFCDDCGTDLSGECDVDQWYAEGAYTQQSMQPRTKRLYRVIGYFPATKYCPAYTQVKHVQSLNAAKNRANAWFQGYKDNHLSDYIEDTPKALRVSIEPSLPVIFPSDYPDDPDRYAHVTVLTP